eukprot:TRINITY_DN12290_c0_g1_i2.p1 TRINITY_DN12290_c0_g1~~TRINITY_DN12290_c0_g1_i2.p1  ORF type:complete len:106 (+),score=41.24 TRINITY_DN12290_c0_g1_i2:64-381(+)
MCIRDRVSTQSTWVTNEQSQAIKNAAKILNFSEPALEEALSVILVNRSDKFYNAFKKMFPDYITEDNKEYYQSYIDFILMTSDICLLYTSPSPRDGLLSRMPSSA